MKGLRLLTSVLIPLVVLLAAGTSGCAPRNAPPGRAPDRFNAALILIGPVNDAGWNASTYHGMRDLSQEMGLDFAYAEAVPFPESQAAIRDYASRGYDLIIANSYGYSDPMAAVARDFPNVRFAVIAGRVEAPNLASYDAGQREGTFLAGALAALMSRTGTIGIVGGVDEPPVVQAVEGYRAGARHVRPDIRVLTAYTGSYTDVARAMQTALAQISSGADTVAHVANQAGLGVIQAASQAGVWAIGTGIDQHPLAPRTVLTTAVTDMRALERIIINDARSAAFGNRIVLPGIREGVAYLSPFYELDPLVPAAVKQQLGALGEAIKAGRIVVPEFDQHAP